MVVKGAKSMTGDEGEGARSKPGSKQRSKVTSSLATAKGKKKVALASKGKESTPGKKVTLGRKSTRTADKKNASKVSVDKKNSNSAVPVDCSGSTIETAAPASFSTLLKEPLEPLHQSKQLKWDHNVNLIGEKVINPMIHFCDVCSLPILVYGRMIPCRHVACYSCAGKAENVCPRCEEQVQRIEKYALGSLYMCSFNDPRHSLDGCGRTYMSQRDLDAHILHRHLKPSTSGLSPSTSFTQQIKNVQPTRRVNLREPRSRYGLSSVPLPVPFSKIQPVHSDFVHSTDIKIDSNILSHSSAAPIRGYLGPIVTRETHSTHVPVMSTRSNLITVPIHDDGGYKTQRSYLASQTRTSHYCNPDKSSGSQPVHHGSSCQSYTAPHQPVTYCLPGQFTSPASTFSHGFGTSYIPVTMSQTQTSHPSMYLSSSSSIQVAHDHSGSFPPTSHYAQPSHVPHQPAHYTSVPSSHYFQQWSSVPQHTQRAPNPGIASGRLAAPTQTPSTRIGVPQQQQTANNDQSFRPTYYTW